MKKRLLIILLALCMALGMLPGTVGAAAFDLPDWYFLFAIFKSVDADCSDGKGMTTHTTYTMTQEEIDITRRNAQAFETYMNQLGVMCAHVDVVEIDTTVTELRDNVYGSWIGPDEAAPLLDGKVDLDQYDHVFCTIDLNVSTYYLGLTGSPFENGTGNSCINLHSREFVLNSYNSSLLLRPTMVHLHEFLHFMEQMDRKWGAEFDLHEITINVYECVDDETFDDYEECYTDIVWNRVNGNAETGTGVSPVVWQYPPHMLRTTQEIIVPEGVTSIGDWAFARCNNLERVTIPSTLTNIGYCAFYECGNLKSVTVPGSMPISNRKSSPVCEPASNSETIPGAEPVFTEPVFTEPVPGGEPGPIRRATGNNVSGIGDYAFCNCSRLENVTIPRGSAGIGEWAFGHCNSLKSLALPSSVSSVGYAAFWGSGLEDIYYGGTETQWKAIQIGEYNIALTGAAIYYNSPESGEPEDDGKPHGTVTVSEVYTPAGALITLTVIPDPGYRLSRIEATAETTGQKLRLSGSGNVYAFTMPASDVHITADFIRE